MPNSNGRHRNSAKPNGLRRFLEVALSDYRHVGALLPSSKYACRSVANQLPDGAVNVVEYGAGSGQVTREILGRLPEHGQLVSLEVNPDFAASLGTIEDQRFTVLYHDVVAASARLGELCEGQIDAVVSGIPFSFIGPADQRQIVANTFDALSAKGHFVVYQNSTRALGLLEEHFPSVQVMFEPRNFLPYFIMVAHKNGREAAVNGEKAGEKRKKRRLATSR